jgi:hypothetical protein
MKRTTEYRNPKPSRSVNPQLCAGWGTRVIPLYAQISQLVFPQSFAESSNFDFVVIGWLSVDTNWVRTRAPEQVEWVEFP